MVFTPFVFIDTIDALFMILSGGNWSVVFMTTTRIVLVAGGAAPENMSTPVAGLQQDAGRFGDGPAKEVPARFSAGLYTETP
jgi:hypothetical protein